MKFFSFLNRHKTKATGAVMVVMGSLQANSSTIQTMVKPRTFAWFTIGIGLIVALLGFLNSRRDQ